MLIARLALPVVVALAIAPAAQASFPHTVVPGETLWGIAQANGMSVSQIAAANGFSPQTFVVAGSTVQIPPRSAVAAPVVAAAPSAASAPPALGGYTVRWGDTLSGLAATARVPAAAIAQMNGLDLNGVLLAGTLIKLPTGSPLPASASRPAPAPRIVAAAPAATPGRVTAADIATVAGRNGVPAPLASAIAWQESGFNNAMVSGANARGVMQVMPGTWQWVQANLARRPLNPNVPIDNVGAGVLYLGHLLRQTGGNEAMAAAAYYQGLASVQRIGMLPETQRYVSNVLALKGRFGG